MLICKESGKGSFIRRPKYVFKLHFQGAQTAGEGNVPLHPGIMEDSHEGRSEFTAVSPKVSRYSAVFTSLTEELKRNKAELKSDLIWVRCRAVLELLWGPSSINRK